MSNPQLENAFRSALVELEQEKNRVNELSTSTRSPRQMRGYLEQLDWSTKQLETFSQVVIEMINERKEQAEKVERVQTYRAKLINLAKDLGMSYQELVSTMAKIDDSKKNHK
ncbi:hypothetical protein [Ferrimonas gelatinilytica]|uniref:Uncharacterized protein n=1 Tax=Ferrimonas gelatinilytica TaxID=1255257 RepID=A0ABP9RZC5_9GAMM